MGILDALLGPTRPRQPSSPFRSSATLERLVQLERSNRRWRRGAVLAVGTTIAALVALAWSPSQAQGPRGAQRFVLLSPAGQAAGAALEFNPRGPELVLFGPGEQRLRIGLDQTGPALELLDERGTKRASLSFSDAEPALVFYDGGLRVRAVVSVGETRPTVVLLDDNRREVVPAP
jgi:hypothetical protein